MWTKVLTLFMQEYDGNQLLCPPLCLIVLYEDTTRLAFVAAQRSRREAGITLAFSLLGGRASATTTTKHHQDVVVVDPQTSMLRNKLQMSAFRSYPPYHTNDKRCPDGRPLDSENDRKRRWGSAWRSYYELQIE